MVTNSADSNTVSVSCPDGKVALGGGAQAGSDGWPYLISSYPTSTGGTPDGWTVQFDAPHPGNTAYVICAN